MGSEADMSRSAAPPLTYEDLARLPEDGKRHEIIGGQLHVNAAPFLRHQQVSRRLFAGLLRQVQEAGLGEVLYAPVDVQLSAHDVVEPDLVVVLKDREAVLHESRIIGAPSLVVEILSPSTARIDRTLKKELFERSGVPEYWLVDTDRNVLESLVLESERYRSAVACRRSVHLAARPEVELDLSRVWSE